MDREQQFDGYPLVTVVMPVYNEGRFIEATIQQLLDQDYPAEKIEILVVDGLSEDNTRAIVRNLAEVHPQIILLDNPKRRSSSGRNIGFKAGKGDYFVVIDGHCYLPDRQLISSIVDNFRKSGADCLGRPQTLDPPGLTAFQKAVALARAARIGHGGDSFIFSDYEGFVSPVSSGAAYRRDVFKRVDYVDENFDAAEDVEFNYRVEKAGLTCYTAPSLKVKYYPRESLGKLVRQLIRYGRGRKCFARKHPAAITLNQLIPLFFVLGLPFAIFSFCLMVFQREVTIFPSLLVLPYVLYLLLLLVTSLLISRKNGWKYFRHLPIIFLIIHFSLGWGWLVERAFGWGRR